MTCASTGAESQKTAPSDAWSSPSGGAGLQLGFAMLFVTLEPQPRCHVFDVSTSFKRNISGQASKIWARTSFRQISLQLRSILHGRLRPCYLLPRLIANRLATWWPTTQKTHLSATGTQWTQPRRTKTCVWQSIWKRIINELNELHFLLYDSMGS